MIRQPPQAERLIGNAELHHLLTAYDPVTAPSQAFLASLEAGILDQIDAGGQSILPFESRFPLWIGKRDWSVAAAVLAVLFVVVSGFLAHQASYGEMEEISLAGADAPALLALAEEDAPAPLYVTSWGDYDDNDQ